MVKEGVTRRKEFDDCLEAIVGSLADTEERYKSVDTGGDGHPLSVQEKVELIRVSVKIEQNQWIYIPYVHTQTKLYSAALGS